MSITKKEKQLSTIQKAIAPQQEKESVHLSQCEPKIRHLKIQPFYRQSQSRFLKKPQPRVVPDIRLCGNWLKEAGFQPQEYARVTVMDHVLIVETLVHKTPEQDFCIISK